MAEALVNFLLERLATIILDKVGGELKLVMGVEEDVKSLARNLEAIQAVLEDAEQRQVIEASVRHWLSELTEVSYQMDNLSDEWITQVRKRESWRNLLVLTRNGGNGKTTLAQLVYNDENVKSHFGKRIWECVSDPFEENKIAKAIIEGFQSLKIVAHPDDVWSPKSHQWEELIKPLRNGAMGSRVLVTTRKEDVAILMKTTTQLIHLKELGETFCLSLFYYNANMDETRVSEEFRSIVLQLVKRCNGLPLAAKS
ncbi:hypothetical protein ACLB2K_074583 [Fragaria x ananassa]